MKLTPQLRRTLRSIQLRLSSSVPTTLLDGVDRNDVGTWAALMMLEVRMLLARGQTYQARKIAELLPIAAEAGIPVETYERREIQQLINAIDSSQAGRHFLVLKQLEKMPIRPVPTIQWASRMWRTRSLAAVGDHEAAYASALAASELAQRVAPDARHWAGCFMAEQLARAGDTERAEGDLLRVLSQFIGWGETRGESLAYLFLALVNELTGAQEESATAAERSYDTDGSWTGPVVWLARLALERGELERASDLLRSIPNPTTEAYKLTQTLALIAERDLPLEPVLEDLRLGRAALSSDHVGALEALLERHPGYTPARETLAFKLLSLGRPNAARAQLEAMVEAEADIQFVAAVRFGLQTFEEEQILDQLFADLGADQPAGPQGDIPMIPSPKQNLPAGEPEPKPHARIETAQVEEDKTPPPPEPEPEPEPEKTSGIVGEISLFGVPDLLQFFCNSRRTGVIAFSNQLGNAKIKLHEGALCWAISPRQPSVADFLRDREAIACEHLAELGEDPDDRLAALVDQGAELEKITAALREMLHLSIKELVDWTEGWFEFDRVEGASVPRPELQFNAQGVLLDVMRELDEERR